MPKVMGQSFPYTTKGKAQAKKAAKKVKKKAIATKKPKRSSKSRRA